MNHPRILSTTVAATALLQLVVWAGAGRGWFTTGQATALHLLVAWAGHLRTGDGRRTFDRPPSFRTAAPHRSARRHAV